MRLHRLLEGDAEAVALPEWVMSRVCEEFAIDPVRAVWVVEHAPLGLIETILDLRAYARTWGQLREARGNTKAQTSIYETASGQQVLEIEAEIVAEARAARTLGSSEE